MAETTSGAAVSDVKEPFVWLSANWHSVVMATAAVAVPILMGVIHIRTRFRTSVKAWVDRPRDRIRVMVRNRGDTPGQIHSVTILSGGRRASYGWLCHLNPQNYTLRPQSTVYFLAEALGHFPVNAKVRVQLKGKDVDRRPRRRRYSWEC